MPPKPESGYRFSATIKISKASATDYKKALGEIRAHERSSITIKETESILQIDVRARDAAALRATINSALKDLHVADSASGL